jgi:hypothetical protein
MEKIFSLIKEADDETLWMFCRDVHDLILEKHFSTHWIDPIEKGFKDKFNYSGVKSIEMIVNLHECKNILDVGCGYNHFKDKFPDAKFTSIEPYIDGADYKMTVTEYQRKFPDRQYDCVMALGSINFGPRAKILEEVEAMDKLTRPEGIQIWRVNPSDKPFVDERFPISELIQYYSWDEPFIRQISELYNYRLIEYKEEIVSDGSRRIFFIMKKSL